MIKCHSDFIENILDKALLSPRYEDHMKQLKQLLQQIYLFNYIEELHVFKPGIERAQTIKE